MRSVQIYSNYIQRIDPERSGTQIKKAGIAAGLFETIYKAGDRPV
jgi:hypothetical protein